MKKSLLIYTIFVLLLSINSYSMPLVPDIYVSAGANYSKVDVSTGGVKTKDSDMAYLLSLGIRPLDVPIFGGLRVEGQYNIRPSNSALGNSYGLVLYYDVLRIIPFVNPYFGIGLNNTKLNSSVDYVNDSQTAFSWHLGLNFELPITGLGVFGEFRNINVKYNDNIQDEYVKAKNYDTLIGLRYYFLK